MTFSLGINVEITKKEKKANTAVESAFLKSDTLIYDIGVKGTSNIKIKNARAHIPKMEKSRKRQGLV